MEKLATTCQILYNQELLDVKRELGEYKKKYVIPKINVSTFWFHRSWKAQNMLDKDQNIIENVRNALQFSYQEEYKKYELFFEEQLNQLEESLKILRNSNQGWYSEDQKDNEYDYCWHFLNNLFAKVNWMHCTGCEEFVRTCRGLCDKCDQLRSPEYPEDVYMDNTDMLADAIDH